MRHRRRGRTPHLPVQQPLQTEAVSFWLLCSSCWSSGVGAPTWGWPGFGIAVPPDGAVRVTLPPPAPVARRRAAVGGLGVGRDGDGEKGDGDDQRFHDGLLAEGTPKRSGGFAARTGRHGSTGGVEARQGRSVITSDPKIPIPCAAATQTSSSCRGLGGSGPDHWQSRWQAKLPNAVRVEQADWDRPVAAEWEARIVAAVARCERPVVAIAHSLGVIALVRSAARLAAGGKVAGAFLVAPPGETTLLGLDAVDPAFRPYPTYPLPFRSLLVGSHDDPYCGIEETATLSAAWGSVFLDAGDAGHINTESGHGPWPEGLMSFGGFLSRL